MAVETVERKGWDRQPAGSEQAFVPTTRALLRHIDVGVGFYTRIAVGVTTGTSIRGNPAS